MNSIDLRNDIIKKAGEFKSSGLSVGKSGNISARHEKGFLITPTGFQYEALTAEDICYCDFSGNVIEGKWSPSSEWQIHADIYQQHEYINAVVHCHSPYATALACCHKGIPAFHYMVAVAGGASIPCAEYATFGTNDLSKNVNQILSNHKACLLANHGQITIGENIAAAFALAEEVENLAKQYCITLQIGEVELLDENEMRINLEKFKHYGKQQGK
ncbi:MAG: class II aldolase/adducin family protein [Pseudomonadota bacterium]